VRSADGGDGPRPRDVGRQIRRLIFDRVMT
jgi:hypothetical protein